MRFKRLMTGALALAATGLLVTACSSKQKANSTGQVAPKQVLDWSYLAELATLDPSKVSDAYSGDIINNSMEGLYRLGKNSKIEPGLATQTEVSDDNLTYTFKLRKNGKWSNGDCFMRSADSVMRYFIRYSMWERPMARFREAVHK